MVQFTSNHADELTRKQTYMCSGNGGGGGDGGGVQARDDHEAS